MDNRKVLDIEVDNFTNSDLKEFKKEYGLNNEDIAKIIGTSLQNVKNKTTEKREISTWSRALLFMWKLNKQKEL